MRGYSCAKENEECKCYGMVDFGDQDNDMFIGKWSEMKNVSGQIKCEKAIFKPDPATESDITDNKCFCYPSSNFIKSWFNHM